MNISSIGAIAITILIAVVMLGLGATILEKIGNTQTDNSATLLNNESLAWAGNNTAISLGQGNIISGTEALYNNGTIVNRGGTLGNYTLSTSGSITIINHTAEGAPAGQSEWVTNTLNVSYSYSIGSAAKNTSNFGSIGILTMASFIPTLAIIVMAAIVIGILLLFFGKRQKV